MMDVEVVNLQKKATINMRQTEEDDSSGTEEMKAPVSAIPDNSREEDSSSGTEDMDEENLMQLKLLLGIGNLEPRDQDSIDPKDSEASLLGHPFAIKKLPSFFAGRCFYFYGNFDNDMKKSLSRSIISYGGEVCDYFYEDQINLVVLSPHQSWDTSCTKALLKNPALKIVQSSWVSACSEAKALVPIKQFLAKRS